MSELQFARLDEEAQLKVLYQLCFPEDDPAFWDWIFRCVYDPQNTLVLRENGRIVASLQMLPCEMQLGAKHYAAHYIYAASTLPERQGRGLMGKLLAQAEEEGRRRGHAFSVLITQEDSLLQYYARFGYRGRLCIGQMPPQQADFSEKQNCRTAVPQDIPALSALYERATTGMLCGLRDEIFWLRQLELFGQGAWVLEIAGRVEAYAFADERGVMEASGTAAGQLSAYICPGKVWRTIPAGQGRPMGSIKPLQEKYREVMEQNPCFLNLMYN